MEIAIESFKAGVDMVLWPDLNYLDEIEKRVNSGEIPMARIDDAVRRIWRVRETHDLLDKKSSIFTEYTEVSKKASRDVGNQLAKAAVTLVEDRNKALPLSADKDKKIAVVSLSFKDIRPQLTPFVERLKANGFDVDPIIHNPGYYNWQGRIPKLKSYDKVIVLFANRNSVPMGASMLKGQEAMGAWTINMLPFDKIISVSFGNPFYVNYFTDTAPIRVNAYSLDPFTQKAVVDGLLGKIPFVGTSPVRLENDILK